MFKKLLTIFLAVIMVVALLSACGSSSNTPVSTSSSTQTTVHASTETSTQSSVLPAAKIRIVYFGDESARMKDFAQNELKDKLAKELNAELELIYLPWSECQTGKTDLMLASGEDFASYVDIGHLGGYKAKGLIQDLTDVVDKSCADMKKTVDELSFKAFQIDGRQYAIPIGNKPNSAEGYCFLVRQDLMDEVGMTSISSLQDLETFYDKCNAKHPDYDGSTVGAYMPGLSYAISNKTIEFLISLGESPIAFVDTSAKDDKVYSWYESEEYKNLAAIAERWNKKGIIPKAELSNPAQITADWNAGKGMWSYGTAMRPIEAMADVKKSTPNAKLENYFITPNPVKISRGTYSTAYFVSTGVKDPARYAMLFNLMQKDQANYDFFNYGVEGKDYTLDGNSVVKKNTDPLFDDWMLANVNYMRFSKDVSEDFINKYKHWNDGCISMKQIGFVFKDDLVKAEAAKIQAVCDEYFKPITQGFMNYDKSYPKALAKLKDAGIDKFMAELQKQFSEFYAKQSK